MLEPLGIDIIILSYAQNDELKNVTTNCVKSLISSEDPERIKFNILVIESQKSIEPYEYDFTRTFYPKEEFNFHRYFNIGINLTMSRYVCLCNNDVLFQKNWASEILAAFEQMKDAYSASPICTTEEAQFKPVKSISVGYHVGSDVQGSCLFFKRTLLGFIGQLDPNFKFYHADDDYAHTLRVLNIKHIQVHSSVVFHLGSETLKLQGMKERYNLTTEQDIFYNKKWFVRLGINWNLVAHTA